MQARTCYTPDELRARVRAGTWLRVFAGAHRHHDSDPTPRLRTSAAGLSIGRPVAAFLHTAADWGFGLLGDPATHVVVDRRSPCAHRDELWPHQLLLRADDVRTLWCGTRATNPERTAVDLARTLPRPDALATLDAALQSGCTSEALEDELRRHVGLPGIRAARELVVLAHPGPDSPQESRLRLLCHDAGLPTPVVQLPGRDENGRARRRSTSDGNGDASASSTTATHGAARTAAGTTG
jgi:transposase